MSIHWRLNSLLHLWFLQDFLPRAKIYCDGVLECVEQFFRGRPLLKSSNLAFLTLIPKKSTASEISDFRPMSCVNLIYNTMAKNLVDRISEVAHELISPNQTAFIQGKFISDDSDFRQYYSCCWDGIWLWEKEDSKEVLLEHIPQKNLWYYQMRSHYLHPRGLWFLLPPMQNAK